MTCRIVMIGATGLVGRMSAERLIAAGHDLRALVRRSTGMIGEIVSLASAWPSIVRGLGADVAVSVIGTTMRIAGSKQAFRLVDYDLAVNFATAARSAGIRHMITVSSVGADSRSRNFYLRTKGDMEGALEALGFDRLDIIRPGLLRGERGTDRRLGERLGILASRIVDPLLRGRLDRYASIDARIVAEAIVRLSEKTGLGTVIHHNRDLRRQCA